MPDYLKFSEKLNVKFNDISLLKRACTHRSYLNENKAAGLKQCPDPRYRHWLCDF